MAKPEQTDAAPRPPSLLTEVQRRMVMEFAKLKMAGGVAVKGCPTCGGSACRCNQPDPVEAELQAAGLL